MLRNVFSYLILTNQIGLAVHKIYHQSVCFTRIGEVCGGCLTGGAI